MNHSSDRICLNQIRGYGYTGALPEETTLGQWFQVDLVLFLDLSAAGESDHLADTLNYCTVIATVQEIIKTSKFALLEKMATAIVDAVLLLPTPIPIERVHISLIKLTPPIPDFAGTVAIELERINPQINPAIRPEESF